MEDSSIIYVGIDVSKKTLDVTALMPDKTSLGHIKVSNDKKGFKKISKWLETLEAQAHICFESTGSYSRGLESYLHDYTSFRVSVCNPYSINLYIKSKLSRTKTDKADSKHIAMYVLEMSPKATTKQDPVMSQLREKQRYIESLKRKKNHLVSELEHYSDIQVISEIKKSIKNLERQMERLEKKMVKFCSEHAHIKKQVELLESIRCIGFKTAVMVLSEMIPQEQGEICKKAQTAHAGLAPCIRQSGTSVNSASLSRVSNSRLKSALYLATLSAIQNNPLIKAFYKRLVESGKPKMVAIVASMRKLLHICIGVLNSRVPFDPEFVR